MPEHIGLLILAACIVLGLALAVLGVVRVVRHGVALKRRLEAYKNLPLRAEVDAAGWRVAAGERAMSVRLPALIVRSRRAVVELDTARRRLAFMAAMVVSAVRRELRL
jgi:hypothetical protein